MRLALVSVFLIAACGGDHYIRIAVDGIPSGTSALVLATSLGGHDASPERFDVHDTSAQSLAFRYPTSLGSWIEMGLTAVDANGCELGWTSTVLATRSYDNTLIDVAMTLGPVSDPPLCNRQRSPGMIVIVEGDYVLGCDDADDPECSLSESPTRSVTLPQFEIDAFEVSVDAYADCMEHGPCTSPHNTLALPTNVARDSLDWFQAQAFCAWRGKRLPTEAEWEAAARGFDARLYPWGDADPDCNLANFAPDFGPENACEHFDTTRNIIGNHPAGNGPSGVLDMAGNVGEWTADWYTKRSTLSDAELLTGPASGTSRVVKGGSYLGLAPFLRCASRLPFTPDGIVTGADGEPLPPSTGTVDRGVRCAR